jgi:hypothetical protein
MSNPKAFVRPREEESPARTRRATAFAGRSILSACLLLWLSLAAFPVAAQQERATLRVELGVDPREVTVGDPFRSAVRVSAPAGYRIEYLEFQNGDSLATTAPIAVAEDSDGRAVGVYSMVAWAVAPELVAHTRIQVTAPDGSVRTHEIRLQLPEVRSVLPARDEEIEPRPPKGVLTPAEPGRFPWWWLAILLALLALAWRAYRAFAKRPSTLEEAQDPRDWALAQLGDDVAGKLLASGEFSALVAHVSTILRSYIERTYGELSRDLTTTELFERLPLATARRLSAAGDLRDRARDIAATTGSLRSAGATARPPSAGSGEDHRALRGILDQADQVKFARYSPGGQESRDLLEAARAWVRRFPPPARTDATPRRAA